jgi:hypothetical protein
MNFKSIYRYGLGILLAAGALLSIQGCEDKDVDGAPVITNIRLLDPAAADSSLSAALPGSKIVIQGQNLRSVLKVYFNDLDATFNSALGSDNNIIITIPADAPTKAVNPAVTNKIRVVTKGGEATYDFSLTSPQPVLSGLYSEFVKPGGTIIINGDYFYNIRSVKLGAANLQVLSSTEKEIRARMPAVASIDYLTVEGEFGTVKTNFKMNDTTVYMMNLDVPVTTWGATVCYGAAAIIPGTDPGAISGKFSRIKQTNLPATGYDDKWVLASCGFDFKLPAGSADQRLFKFEHNVVEPWKAGKYDIMLKAGDVEYTYAYQPWNSTQYASTGYLTNGWKTAVIELTEFKSPSGGTIADVSKIGDIKVSFSTPDKVIDSFNTSVDNFRIVAK